LLVTALLSEASLQVRALDFSVEGYLELPYAQQVADFLQIPLVRVATMGDRLRGGTVRSPLSAVHTTTILHSAWHRCQPWTLGHLGQRVQFSGEGECLAGID